MDDGTRQRMNAQFSKGNAILAEYEKQHDRRWANAVLSSGTVADRVAALTLLAENEPLVCLRPLDTLLSLAHADKRREMQMAVESLQHIFRRLLPQKRRLLRFDLQPGAREGNATSRQLLAWAFEAGLKKRYKSFVDMLEHGASDRVFYIKRMCVRASFEMLCARPEQEQALLALVVNKLGDPEARICSMVVHLLLQLTTRHPAMKVVVFGEVEKQLFRPNSARTIYNCVCFLNRIKLRRCDDGRFAKLLVHTYFQLFSRSVGCGEAANAEGGGAGASTIRRRVSADDAHRQNRLLGMLLIGINRALPYTDYRRNGSGVLASKTDPLFRLVEAGGVFNTAVEALAVLVQIVRVENTAPDLTGRGNVVDRFYRELDCKIGDPDLIHSSKRALFLNILYRAVKGERMQRRSRLLEKHLLRVAAFADSPFAAGALFLLSKAQSNAPQLRHVTFGAGGTGPLSSNAFAAELQLFLWEFCVFLTHFHPSVRKLVQLLVRDQGEISYRGDPLQDLQMTSFLDVFFAKAPKRRTAQVHDNNTRGNDCHADGTNGGMYNIIVHGSAQACSDKGASRRVLKKQFFCK